MTLTRDAYEELAVALLIRNARPHEKLPPNSTKFNEVNITFYREVYQQTGSAKAVAEAKILDNGNAVVCGQLICGGVR